MGKALEQDRIADYWDQGYAFPAPVMAPEEAAGHRARLEAAEAAHRPLHYVVKPYLFFSSAWEIARHPVLLDAVEDILGPDILLWDSAYVIKEARDPRYVSWHQDLTYWGLDSDELVTAWVALSPARPETGGMRMLPGSHRAGRLAHRDTHDAANILHRGQEVAAEFDESAAVDVVLAPGEASLHHGWVMHASHGNPSGDRRIALSLQYLTPRVRQTKTDRESATLVRGADRYGHFRPEPEFAGDFAPAALAFQQEVERLKHEVYETA